MNHFLALTLLIIFIIILSYSMEDSEMSISEMLALLKDNLPSDPDINDQEFHEFARLLAKFVPPTTQPRYNLIASAGVAFTALETAIMRAGKTGAEIVLIQRRADDVLYGGMRHSPGTMLRSSDAMKPDDDMLMSVGNHGASAYYQRAFERVLGELGFSAKEITAQGLDFFKQKPVDVGGFVYLTPRGAENARLYIAEIAGEPRLGKFFPIVKVLDNPPAFNLIEHQIPVLAQLQFRFENFYPTLRSWQGW